MFDWVNPAAYKPLHIPLSGEGADEKIKELVKLLDEGLEKNVVKAAAMPTPFLTANLGLAPAVAVLASTLIVKRVSELLSLLAIPGKRALTHLLLLSLPLLLKFQST